MTTPQPDPRETQAATPETDAARGSVTQNILGEQTFTIDGTGDYVLAEDYAQMERQRDEALARVKELENDVEKLIRSNQAWEADAKRYCQNSEYHSAESDSLRQQLATAKADALRELEKQAHKGQMLGKETWWLDPGMVASVRAVLEGQPEGKTPWSDSQIHEQIRKAGVEDNAAPADTTPSTFTKFDMPWFHHTKGDPMPEAARGKSVRILWPYEGASSAAVVDLAENFSTWEAAIGWHPAD